MLILATIPVRAIWSQMCEVVCQNVEA